MASRLTAAAWQRAADFIQQQGTNLHRELFQFHFGGGAARNVLAALSYYRNIDGGFGHGLEPDLRTRQSSVIATTVALQVITETGELGAPMARDAVQYLCNHYEHDNWPLINEACNDAPCAPWWIYNEHWAETGGFHANPGAEILSYLMTWCAMGKTTRQGLWQRALDHIAGNRLEMHELLCYLRLYQNHKLMQSQRQKLLPLLLSQACDLVKVAPLDWEEYGLMPISVVETPASPLMGFFGEILDGNFEYQIARQCDDGSWAPSWSWGTAWPEAWRQAEVEIKSMLTLRFLCQLQRFDRLPLSI